MTFDSLLDGVVPTGDAQYVREEDGTWGVAIFTPGSTHMVMKIGTGMDKNVAAWIAFRLRNVMSDRGVK